MKTKEADVVKSSSEILRIAKEFDTIYPSYKNLKRFHPVSLGSSKHHSTKDFMSIKN